MEELDILGALELLQPFNLGPVERVLAGHTGTVQLLLSLLFGEPVDVVMVGQSEVNGPVRREIHREVSLKLRHRELEVCRAVSVIDLQMNDPEVLADIREGKLGLGQLAVKYDVLNKRTIDSIEVDQVSLRRQYTMDGYDPGKEGQRQSGHYLHFVITEVFSRDLFQALLLGPAVGVRTE